MLATAVKTVIVDLSQGLAMAAGDKIPLENAADYAQEMAEPRQARMVVVQAVAVAMAAAVAAAAAALDEHLVVVPVVNVHVATASAADATLVHLIQYYAVY